MKWTRVQIATFVGIALVVAIFADGAWHHRWISDDGLIFVRIARQIAAGHGPVFNTIERTEANTSALWPWLIAAVGVTGSGGASNDVDFSWIAVWLGLACSVGGLALAMDGTRRWQRMRGSDAVLVPVAALLVIGVVPFWDFATSGLESGLTFLWIGASWWLFVTLVPESSRNRQLGAAFVFGLGPLVRPDLGIASVAFWIGAWALVRPARRQAVAMIGIAVALPLAYEVFRAGFYGTLVPLPALAKSATGADWGRGIDYLLDFARPSWVGVPLAVLAALFALVVARRGVVRRDRVVVAVPVLAGIAMGAYVVRVGGDFMHARMMLPATFMLALPGFVLPLRRFSAPAIAAVIVWAAVIGHALSDNRSHGTSVLAGDERVGYIGTAHDRHPTDESYAIAGGEVTATMLAAARIGERIFYSEGGVRSALDPAGPASVFVAGRLGYGGLVTPLDGVTVDTLGLANPIGARIELTHPEEPPGHQKVLPWAWTFADFGDPARDADAEPMFEATPSAIAAARRAGKCGELRELLDSVREPLTAGRFFANLVGSVRRTRLAIPSDPVAAELRFCGTSPAPAAVIASSSCERFGWGKAHAVDGIFHTRPGSLGYSSEVWNPAEHAEWLELELRALQRIASVTMYPRDDDGFIGAGFPIDFSIQTWDGARWVAQVTRTGVAPPPDAPQVFAFAPVTTQKIRIAATKLQNVPGDGYVFQLAELAVGIAPTAAP